MAAPTLTEFILARCDEDEERVPNMALLWPYDGGWSEEDCDRQMAEVRAKRRIVAWHEAWPVLSQQPPVFEPLEGGVETTAFRVSQQIEWLTTREYRARFGDEPPSSPMLLALAAVYSDHSDYNDDWRI